MRFEEKEILSVSNESPEEVRKALDDMRMKEQKWNYRIDHSWASENESKRSDTVFRLLEDAIKDIQTRITCREMRSPSSVNDLSTNGSLNQTS